MPYVWHLKVLLDSINNMSSGKLFIMPEVLQCICHEQLCLYMYMHVFVFALIFYIKSIQKIYIYGVCAFACICMYACRHKKITIRLHMVWVCTGIIYKFLQKYAYLYVCMHECLCVNIHIHSIWHLYKGTSCKDELLFTLSVWFVCKCICT